MRELKLDMVIIVIIVIIQISALTFGLVQIEKERLIALVHYDGVIHLAPKKNTYRTKKSPKRYFESKSISGHSFNDD